MMEQDVLAFRDASPVAEGERDWVAVQKIFVGLA
jgi:hypothetical protein